MKPRYTGPMIVVVRNPRGSYIVAEMTGAVWQHKVARFRVIPYFARKKIDLPEGIMKIIDVDEETLDKICAQPEEYEPLDRDYLMDSVAMSILEDVAEGDGGFDIDN